MSAGLVSVVVPFHDAGRFLEEAVESVLRQTYRPIELILVDDASTDDGGNLARALAARHPDIRLLRMPENAGPAAARNRGLAEAHGEYITFLDADDVMVNGRLALQADHLARHPEVDIVLGAEEPIIEADAPRDLLRRRRSRGDGVHYYPMSMIFRRSALERVGGFDPSFAVAEDLDWLFRAAAAGLVVGTIEEVLTRHRLHAGNLSYQTAEIQRSMLRSLRSRLRERRG